MKFRLPTLPFGHADLEPFLSSEAIDCHYFGHHKGYITKTNELVKELDLEGTTLEKIILNHDGKLFNNAAQAWNHTFFWLGLSPRSKAPSGEGELMASIDKSFGGLEKMKERFMECGTNLFGSGWTWLVVDDLGQLEFTNMQNADNPIRIEKSHPVWVCDVWEHAYYIDYRNGRKEFLEGAWKHVNWEFIAYNLKHRRTPNMTKYMTDDPADVSQSEISAPSGR